MQTQHIPARRRRRRSDSGQKHIAIRWVAENRGHETPCWIWQLVIRRNGYGAMGVNGREKLAHRVAYEERFGPIPAGLEIDHLCRTKECVNPDHLEAVTPLENKRRSRSTRLMPRDVIAIRDSSERHAVIAARYGITKAYVGDIKHGRAWADLSP